MTPFWIRALPLYRAAHFSTFMLLALFQLVADSLALQVINRIDFLSGHQLLAQLVWVVHLIAGELCLALVAGAALVDKLLASHAAVVVALFDALVFTAGQEFIAERVADGNRLDASLSLATQQTLNSLMTARTVDLARWIFLTGQAFTLVARFLAVVMFAIKGSSTGLLARKASLTTEPILHLLATIALYLFGLFAGIARPRMALLLTLVNPAVQCLVACIFAAELTSTSNLTRNILHLLAAVTANRHANVAGWTGTWVARNLTVLVLTVSVSGSLAMLTARVRQKHRVILRFFVATAVAEVFGHLVLRVAELAVRTGPIEEGKE